MYLPIIVKNYTEKELKVGLVLTCLTQLENMYSELTKEFIVETQAQRFIDADLECVVMNNMNVRNSFIFVSKLLKIGKNCRHFLIKHGQHYSQ